MTTAIIDYGSGNLRSAAKAFERAAADAGLSETVLVTDNADQVAAADRVVLPGVGAFGDCRAGVYGLPGMVEALEATVIDKGRPFLGICVGMQLMADRGLEHGGADGFGWIPGEVCPLEPADPTLKVPHMGWNDLRASGADSDDLGTRHPVLDGMTAGDHVYFVHSFGFICATAQHRLAEVEYGDAVTAMVGRDNMIGTQFHPEKSQAVGLKFIENFLRWRP
jgi:imidazole glycerol-phosphate synthase subunit HisH